MTSISSPVASAQVRAAPKAKARNAALDRARTFITMLVLIHHSVIAYTYFGHTDRDAFLGFDCVVMFNDSFFMAAMFFLSGLFVWPSLKRKGTGWFLRDRFWRLGLPFAVCALILMPVAYYAVSLRYHPEIGFTAFWWNMVTVGPWPSGPAWFVWVLLALDVIAAIVYLAAPGLVEAIGRLSLAGYSRPGLFFSALLIASIVVYLPSVLYFGASRWFTVGPLAIQASRILLYLLYFFAGVGIGAVPLRQGRARRRRRTGAALAAVARGDGRDLRRNPRADLRQALRPARRRPPAAVVGNRLCAGVRILQRRADAQYPRAVPALFQ